MSHRSRSSRRGKQRASKLAKGIRFVVSNSAHFLLVGAVVLTVGAIAFTLRSLPITVASGTGGASSRQAMQGTGPRKVTCGLPGQAPCATTLRWIPLRSESAADIIAAARQSPLFTVDRSGNGDYVKDLSHIGTPVFVRALHAVNAPSLPDCYVIPVHDGTGMTMAAAELEINSPHTAILVMAIVTYSKLHPHDTITRLSLPDALTAVESQHHTALRGGARAQLVYFPVNAYSQATGKIMWVAGGEYPADPLWFIPGADGQDHIVGADGHVYYANQLPISG